MFSDSGTLSHFAESGLVVDPVDSVDMQVQPTSVDLRLSTKFLEFQHTNVFCIHPNRESEMSEYVRETHVPEDDDFILHLGDFALGTTKERAEIPTDLLAIVEGRSSLGHPAVVIHTIAGIVDPDYKGQIMLELSNLGTAPVVLTPGVCISQFAFTETKPPADRPYGVEHGSRYQGQRRPQTSRLDSDPESGGGK